jgi:hypothetical protein
MGSDANHRRIAASIRREAGADMSDFFDSRRLNVIHFTHGATDPLQGFRTHGVRVVMLADGGGSDETYVSCFHFEPGGWVKDPPVGRDSAILVVHGSIILKEWRPQLFIHRTSSGVGVVLSADVRYSIESETGAILIVVEAERLQVTPSGVSTPGRVWGQVWPGEKFDQKPRTLLSIWRSISFRWRFRKLRRLNRVDRSGWESVPPVGLIRWLLFGRGKKAGEESLESGGLPPSDQY